MGKQRMKCLHCGTENVNDMLVEFTWLEHVESKGGIHLKVKGDYLDITTLPKFLHYLRYPEDVGRMEGREGLSVEPKGGRPIDIKGIYCTKCVERGKRTEIKPTRFGV